MDIAQLKQLAKRLHSFLQPQLGAAFKLGQAQELMAVIVGVRNWSEVLASTGRLASITIEEPSLNRLAARIYKQYSAKVSAEGLQDALFPQDATSFINAPRRAIVSGRIPDRWLCDVCGRYIDSVDHAYVVWKGTATDHSFRIIHQSDCDIDDSFHSSNPLRDYVGQEGLNKLLVFLSPGMIIRNLEKQPRAPILNVDEIVDFIRRCQIPNYDLARRLFKEPRVVQEYHGSNESSPYRPERLAEMLREFGEDEA